MDGAKGPSIKQMNTKKNELHWVDEKGWWWDLKDSYL